MKKLDKRINELNQILKKRQNEYEVIKENFYKLEKEIAICNNFIIKRLLKRVIRNISKLIDLEYYVNILKKERNYNSSQVHKEVIEKKMRSIEVELKYLLEQKSKRKEYIFSDVVYSEELRAEVINLNRQCEPDKRKIEISEHGLLRYLERVKGINIEAIKKEMIPEELLELSDHEIKDLNYEKTGLKYVVKGNKIITVINKRKVKKKYEIVPIEKIVSILNFINKKS
ncbi:MAG: hypothetical protein RR523_06440 [Cetobacterium sp.]|uniref:hypothetical protein n=1 Tax=Cetobacterium sp. TaxID=2071632 RepID=UPI002FCA240E